MYAKRIGGSRPKREWVGFGFGWYGTAWNGMEWQGRSYQGGQLAYRLTD